MIRVTMTGSFRDFKNLDKALEYIKKIWRESSNINIRTFMSDNVITQGGFKLQR